MSEPQWSQEPPTQAGTYWNWNGSDDDAPVPMFVGWSGHSGKTFVRCGQLCIERAIDCDEYGGWWLKIETPETPRA